MGKGGRRDGNFPLFLITVGVNGDDTVRREDVWCYMGDIPFMGGKREKGVYRYMWQGIGSAPSNERQLFHLVAICQTAS